VVDIESYSTIPTRNVSISLFIYMPHITVTYMDNKSF